MSTPARNERLWKLYDKHRQELYTYALSIARNQSLAEDVVQNAIAAVAQQDGSVRNLKAYVFRTIRNSALKEIATAAKSRSLTELELDSFVVAPPESRPEREFQRKELAKSITMAFEKIPREQKETIVLRIYGRLRFRTIAEILNQPLSTITSRYRRGLEALAEHLKEYSNES